MLSRLDERQRAKDSALRRAGRSLFRFALLLLSDADLEVLLLGFLERLVIVARHGFRQVLIHVRLLGQDGHQGETVIAGWAKGPEPLHIRNCHNSS